MEVVNSLGGSGSTRWNLHRRRRVVDETFSISISDVAGVVDLKNLGPGSGCVRPTNPTGHIKKISVIRCDAGLSEGRATRIDSAHCQHPKLPTIRRSSVGS
jgi:hypothetical protein